MRGPSVMPVACSHGRLHGAGRDAARDGDRDAVAFLVGLRPVYGDLEAVVGFLEVGNVEGHELGPATLPFMRPRPTRMQP